MFESIEKELAVKANKAREAGCWFYCVRTGHWITPEEYEAQGQADLIMYGRNCRTVIVDYYMQDPRAGIRSRMNSASKATADLQEFTERVFAYFNQVPKNIK